MKHVYFTLALCLLASAITAQIEWTGPMITVTKTDFADWTLEENQDRITPNVWLTRANSRGLFNIASETEFDDIDYTSPAGTLWANGSIADGVGTLIFQSWDSTNDQGAPVLNQNQVLFLVDDNIYIDFVITAWTQGNGDGVPPGGGFTYMRSTDTNANIATIDAADISIASNPVKDDLLLLGLQSSTNYEILDITGALVTDGIVQPSERIDTRILPKGIYLLRLESGLVLRLLRE